MNLTPVLPEHIAIDEKVPLRFARTHAHFKLAVLAFGSAALVLAAVVTGHLAAVPGSAIVAAGAALGFFAARRTAALLGERDDRIERSAAPV
jgi:uncharacterized membrane protein YfcA